MEISWPHRLLCGGTFTDLNFQRSRRRQRSESGSLFDLCAIRSNVSSYFSSSRLDVREDTTRAPGIEVDPRSCSTFCRKSAQPARGRYNGRVVLVRIFFDLQMAHIMMLKEADYSSSKDIHFRYSFKDFCEYQGRLQYFPCGNLTFISHR